MVQPLRNYFSAQEFYRLADFFIVSRLFNLPFYRDRQPLALSKRHVDKLGFQLSVNNSGIYTHSFFYIERT